MFYKTYYIEEHLNNNNLENIREQAIENIFNNNIDDDNLELIQLNYRPKLTRAFQDEETLKENISQNYLNKSMNIFSFINRNINEFFDNNYNNKPIEEYYTTFRIPKSSGGTRKITAPEDGLKKLLSDIQYRIQEEIKVLEHNNAFAYIKGRDIKDALTVHQANKSNWFLKIDFKDFFPSFNKQTIIKTLNKIYPFNFLYKDRVEDMVDVSLYNNGLPQGSPLSPLLSNLCLIEFDKKLTNKLWNFNDQHYVYTRYADDIIISSKYDFTYSNIIELIKELLEELDLPLEIKHSKTRYGSRHGRNWNLGLMLNKDNKITIGYKKKRRMKAMLFSFIKDTIENNLWGKQEFQEFQGQLNYISTIEPEYWRKRIRILEDKLNVDFKRDILSKYKV